MKGISTMGVTRKGDSHGANPNPIVMSVTDYTGHGAEQGKVPAITKQRL